MHRLGVDPGVKRTHIILVPVNIKLWLCSIGALRLVAKDLELFGGNGRVKILYYIARAEFLRGVAIGT